MTSTAPPSHAPRPRCAVCQRPLAACLCAWVRPMANRVPVQLWQHPAEAGHAKGSARLLAMSLAQCQAHVGLQMDPAALPAGTALLYPGATSTAAAPVAALLVLDGTWRQSRQLLRLNPWLLALPRVSLASPPPSRYAARRAHRPEQRSTLEATCLALQALEADAARYAPLLEAFSGWVQTLGRPGSTA